MAKVGKQKIKVGDEHYNMIVEYEVNVSKEGLFTTTLKEEDALKIESYGVRLFTNGRSNGRKGFFSAETMKELAKEIHDKLNECYTRKVIREETLIRYVLNSSASFGYTLEGGIIPNLGWHLDGEIDKEKYWQHGTEASHSSHNAPIGIAMYVDVVRKITYEYKGGETKEVFEKITSKTDKDKYYLSYISSIPCLSKPYGELREIEYTEKNAKFFVDLFKSLCKMSELVKSFENPETLLKLIDTNQKLLG